MALRLYFDVHVSRAIVAGLRVRAVECITAHDDGQDTTPDPALLDRATALGCVLVSFDRDLLVEAARRQHAGIPFGGLISIHPQDMTVGAIIEDLEVLAKFLEPVEMNDRVEYLPL